MSKDEIFELLKNYKQSNADKYGILMLGIFGSFARGDYNANSDVDICITTIEPDPHKIFRIKEDLENEFHRHVDIVRLRKKMNPFLKKRIEKECVYV